tara:strand:+ start:767 stop:958 length:192 start_codon:yes stop_codon:yes gene_type:complete
MKSTMCTHSFLFFDVVIAQLEVSGLGALPLSEWKDLVALRRSLPSASASILMACQFNACAGQV